MLETGSSELRAGSAVCVCVCVCVCVSVSEVCVDVDLLLDPGCEVRHVAVHSRSEHFTEAHTAPRRQAEQSPATTAVLLTHQRTAAVALHTCTHTQQCLTCFNSSTTQQNKIISNPEKQNKYISASLLEFFFVLFWLY